MSTIFSLLTATLVIFARDLIRDRREKQRMAAELAAGRAVQQVLIPEEIPIIPGFNIQSVYKPFGEVGGDFFQVLPISSDSAAGGVLVIIGDVSGKGMPAAMTVSLLVGTVRTLAHYTRSPGKILAAMNQRMLARSNGGFTTCLVLCADPDGTLTISNAGHIAPYLDGQELPLENGLPLGISPDTIYAESTFRLAPRQQLTLLTDGVIEARDKAGRALRLRTQRLSERAACRSHRPGSPSLRPGRRHHRPVPHPYGRSESRDGIDQYRITSTLPAEKSHYPVSTVAQNA
jgi:serine phosphatase RsbU (regulator of sigma subunit)